MSPERKRIISKSPLSETNEVQLPGGSATAMIEAPKTFSYRLPPHVGMKFKMLCQMEGITAEKKLAEILAQYMSDKEVRL